MLELEKIFSDGMVLQRRSPIRIWGKCGAARTVKVSIGDLCCTAEVAGGKFCAQLPEQEAAERLTLKLSAEDAEGRTENLEIPNVAIGEVWIAAGQSNMEYPVRNTVECEMLKQGKEDGNLRFFDVPKISYEGQENDRSYDDAGFWDSYRPDSIDNFSAVGLMFALRLRRELDVPVGIIGCNWGATSASSWIPREYLEEHEELKVYLKDYEEAVRGLDLEWYRQTYLEKQAWGLTPRMAELNDKLSRGELDIGEMMKRFSELPKRQREYLTLPTGPMDQRRPCVLYDTMVKRIMGYTLKGVLWYQGEADEVHPDSYALLFSQLVKCWRRGWGQELPFLTVQLAPFREWLGNTGRQFPALRAQQELAAALVDGVWLACIMDAGMEWDIHPKTKGAAAERLALLALGKIYGKQILCDAPEAAGTRWEKNRIIVYLAHAGEGLHCTGEGNPAGIVLMADGKEIGYQAEVRDCRLIVHTPDLTGYRHVQLDYARLPYVEADLYNSAGLCAKPFCAVRPWDWRKTEE